MAERKSGNPAKRTTTKKAPVPGKGRVRPRPTAVTPVGEWLEAEEGQLLELPSGKVVRAIMPGMQAFVKADLIPNELMPIVLSAINEQNPMSEDDAAKLAQDPSMLVKMADAFDQIFVYCVVEPKFELPPDEDDRDKYNELHPDEPVGSPDELRVRGTLYVDRVSMDDKGYIFNCAVGGTRDLETFREESRTQLETVSARSGL